MPGKPNSSLTASLGEEGRERAQRERKTQGETEQHREQRQREREGEMCAHKHIYVYTYTLIQLIQTDPYVQTRKFPMASGPAESLVRSVVAGGARAGENPRILQRYSRIPGLSNS